MCEHHQNLEGLEARLNLKFPTLNSENLNSHKNLEKFEHQFYIRMYVYFVLFNHISTKEYIYVIVQRNTYRKANMFFRHQQISTRTCSLVRMQANVNVL